MKININLNMNKLYKKKKNFKNKLKYLKKLLKSYRYL